MRLFSFIFFGWSFAALLEEATGITTYDATVKMVNPASEDDSVAEFISLDDSTYLNEIEEADPEDSKIVLVNGVVVLLASAGFNGGLCYELMQVREYLDTIPGFRDIDLFKLVMFSLLTLVFDQMFGAHCVLNSRNDLSNYKAAPSFILPFIKFAMDFAALIFVTFGSDLDVKRLGPDMFLGLTVQTSVLFILASLYSIVIAVLYRK